MIKTALKKVIANKIEQLTFKQLMFEIDKSIIFAGILALLIDRSVVDFVFEYESAIIIKSVVVLNLYVFFDTIVIGLSGLWGKLPTISIIQDHFPAVSKTIKHQDIAEMIINHNGFPYVIAKQQFGMSAKEHKKIGDELEALGLLIRSDKNARILSADIDVEKLSEAVKRIQENDRSPTLIKTLCGYDVENYGKHSPQR